MSSYATIRVDNLRQFTRKCDQAGEETSKFFREGLLAVGEEVAKDIRSYYADYSAKGAGGVKAKVTKGGSVIAAQTLRKSRGLKQRKNFGPLMFSRAFEPGLDDGAPLAEASLAVLMDNLERVWEG